MPLVGNLEKQVLKPLWRQVGAPEEGLQFRGHQDRHGPTPTTRGSLYESHVDLVHIRPLFSIHFDIDKVLVHDGGDLRIGKGFTLHHVTPMTRRISDGKKNRPVLFSSLAERFLSPGIPVNRISGMLQQVGALLVNQAIGLTLLLRDRALSGRRKFGRAGRWSLRFNGTGKAVPHPQCDEHQNEENRSTQETELFGSHIHSFGAFLLPSDHLEYQDSVRDSELSLHEEPVRVMERLRDWGLGEQIEE